MATFYGSLSDGPSGERQGRHTDADAHTSAKHVRIRNDDASRVKAAQSGQVWASADGTGVVSSCACAYIDACGTRR